MHLAGRTRATLEEVAQRIRHDGGAAHLAEVDVLDRAAVARRADGVAAAGGIDICFNATSNDDVQGTPLLAMPFEDLLRLVTKAVTAHFNIAVAAGRHVPAAAAASSCHGRRTGGDPAARRLPVAWAALAGLCRQLAAEFGPYGVRVSWLLSPGSPGSDEHDQPQDGTAGETPRRGWPRRGWPRRGWPRRGWPRRGWPEAGAAGAPDTAGAPGTAGLLVRHLPSYDEVANIAAFAASDWARTITASEINFTGGAVVD